MPTSYEVTHKPKEDNKKKPKKPTSKDLPGSGLLKDAGKAVEARQAKRKKLMNELFGG